MRIHAFELVDYGAFTGRTIELGPGLTVVYGPNESGKSTFRNALAEALWGMRTRRHPYAFRVAVNKLTLRATVARDDDDDPHVLTITPRGCTDGAGEEVEPWWRQSSGHTRESWEAAFSLDHTRLQEQGRAALTDDSDLADLMFQARTGLDLADLKARLADEAEELYKRHGGAKSTTVRKSKQKAELAAAETKKATSSAAEVDGLRKELDEAREIAEREEQRYAELQRAAAALDVKVKAWEHARTVVGLRARIAEVRAEGRTLDTAALERLETYLEQQDEASETVARLERALAAEQQKLDELRFDEQILTVAEDVRALVRRRPDVEREQKDADDAEKRLRQIRADIREAVRSLAPARLADVDESSSDDQVRALAHELLLPEDAEDTLERLTEEISEAERLVEAARSSLAEAALDGQEHDGRGDAAGGLKQAREARDAAWAQIKKPWLAGAELPEGDRVRAAEQLDAALEQTDDQTELALSAAESGGRASELLRQLRAREKQLTAALDEHQRSLDRWEEALGKAGLPLLDLAGWRSRRKSLAGLAELLAEESMLLAQIEQARKSADRFAQEILDALSPVQVTGSSPASKLAAAEKQVENAKQGELKAEDLRNRIAELGEQLREASEQREQASVEVAKIAADDDVVQLCERSHRLHDLQDDERKALELLEAVIGPGENPRSYLDELPQRTLEELEDEADKSEQAKNEQLGRRDDARDAQKELQRALEDATRIGSAAKLHQAEVEAAERLVQDVENYLRRRIMTAVLDRVRDDTDPKQDNELVAHAADMARAMTGGRVSDLRVRVDETGASSLEIVADDLADGVPDELSEGTAYPVFLALRLAGIRQLQQQARRAGGEPMPVVLDDVLMTHDDTRTALALDVLMDEARDQQIVLTTHHASVAELARERGAHVVELDPRPDRPLEETPSSAVRAAAAAGGPAGDDVRPDPAEVRRWAQENGYPVAERGRIPASIVAAYLARDLPGVDEPDTTD